VASSWILFFRYQDDAQSSIHQIRFLSLTVFSISGYNQ